MSRFPSPRTLALALTLSAASCISITSTSTFHRVQGPFIGHSNVAVLESPASANLVVIAEGRSDIHVYTEDGSYTGIDHELDFDIKVMAPGPDRELWILDTTGDVHRLTFSTVGTLLSNEEEFPVVNGEDIAVASDGGSIYIVDDSRAYRYDLNGLQLANVPIHRPSSVPMSASTQRIAVDHETGFVYTAETSWVSYGGPWQRAVRVVQHSAGLGSPQASDILYTDSRNYLVDFEIADGTRAWERSNGFGAGLLEIVSSGEVRDQLSVSYTSAIQADSLSTAGVSSSFSPCGGSEGTYLWRSRNNVLENMLERHTVCAD